MMGITQLNFENLTKVDVETDKLKEYGYEPLVYICREHDKAWGTWLDKHPGKRDHIAPRGRSVRANWIEVFREFIEDMRVGQCLVK